MTLAKAEIDPEKLLQDAIAKAQEMIANSRPDMARDIAKQILRCQPDNTDAMEILGLAHHQRHEYKQAIKFLRAASEAQPFNADFLNNLALPLSVTGQVEESIALLERASNLSPNNPRYLANLALQYRCAGNVQVAVEVFNRSLEVEPLATTYINLGGTLGEAHRLEEATQAFRRAIELEPNNAMAHTDLAYSLHLQGNYTQAWKEYEWRYKSFSQLQPYLQKYDQKLRWNGESLSGKRLMIYCEQGLGDTIQFIRKVSTIKRGDPDCYIIVHCAESLVGLLTQSDLGIDEFFTVPVQEMTWVTPHDYHIASMSLPAVMWNESRFWWLDWITDEQQGRPYLKSEAHDMGHADKKRYGICWAGSPLHPNDRIRSCPLREFQAIHDLPGVKLFGLADPRIRRYPDGNDVDLTEGCNEMRIVDCWSHMTDFQRTASILKGLDGIITVDTAIMHLAGALGVPTIGLLAYNPDWRWGLESSSTHWYSSLTLVRQPRPGDWTSVFTQVKDLLEAGTCVTSSP